MALSAFISSFDDPRSQLRRLGQAGQSYAASNFDPRFPTLSADQASSFDTYMNQARDALTAPAGSIAARNNPFRYGSVASRQFPGTFGREGVRGFDAAQGMLRRYGDDDGYGT